MNKAKVEKRIKRKIARAKPCPFCGGKPTFVMETSDPIREWSAFGHYATMKPCCRVFGCGRTELFFTHNKPNLGLWKNMAMRFIDDWNKRLEEKPEGI